MTLDILRRCIFRPYRKGCGPTFRLTTWATNRYDNRGQQYIGYRLTAHDHEERVVIFEGEDFAGSPMNGDDSDATVAGIMGFLTLRPGDTDQEYFDGYTPVQVAYCDHHAESLACEIMARFPEGE